MKIKGDSSSRLVVIIFLVAILIATPFALRLLYLKEFPGLTGKAASTVFIGDFYNSTCSLYLVSGWNLISVYCEANNMSVSNVLSSLDNNYVSIHTYDRYDPSDKWKAYKPDLPSWVIQDLSTISVEEGYWINMENDDSFVFNGTLKFPRIIFLFEDWNLVGYPSNKTRLVNETFVDVLPNLDSVHMYNASDSADHWKVYSPSVAPSQNDLVNTTPMYGYWVKMNANDTWMVDE